MQKGGCAAEAPNAPFATGEEAVRPTTAELGDLDGGHWDPGTARCYGQSQRRRDMLRRAMVLVLACAGVIGGLWLAQGLSQQGPRERARPGAEARPRGDRSERMAEFMRRRDERMREQLGATEAEWTKVLKPRIDKVQTLQRQMRGGFRGRRPRRAEGAAEGAARPEQSDVETKTAAAAIKAALGALRKAREKTQKELDAARKKLQEVVTVRQEAQLVLTGVLD